MKRPSSSSTIPLFPSTKKNRKFPLFLLFLGLTIIFSYFMLNSPNPFFTRLKIESDVPKHHDQLHQHPSVGITHQNDRTVALARETNQILKKKEEEETVSLPSETIQISKKKEGKTVALPSETNQILKRKEEETVALPSETNQILKKKEEETVALPREKKERVEIVVDKNCDLSKGKWIRDYKGSRYTNSSCITIPDSKNCFRHGRQDTDFLNWRWKPDRCELPRFDAKAFLEIVKDKTLAFVGDSVARNHMESLLCLLSQEEVPIDKYKDSEDRNRIWYFPVHNFTLIKKWTIFLVHGEERTVNGSGAGVYDLNLDKLDENWGKDLATFDYVIISDGHWFNRKMYLHQGSRIVACVYCGDPKITDRGEGFAVQMAFRSALKGINSCKECKKSMVTLLRTFSPAHFEHGFWNTGGTCNRTRPLEKADPDSFGWKIKRFQVQEVERAMKEVKRSGKRFGTVDVTGAMLMRPDGHPDSHWGNQWMRGYNDCVHWCLPGPIDLWNDFLFAVFKRMMRA